MNLLVCCEIRDESTLPDFGVAFALHMQKKRNSVAFRASLSAWKLLETALRSTGVQALPQVVFSDTGKPGFVGSPLHFSLSHSGNIAAAILSDKPCGVDVEIIRPEIAGKLRSRVLSEAEMLSGEDFFSVWTKKEAAVKLSSKGLPSRPCEMDLSEYEKMNRLQTTLTDLQGQQYFLTALCDGDEALVLRTLSEISAP